MALNLQLLDDVGRTFDWQPDPAQYFPTPATELVRAGLRRSLESGSGVLVLTGGAGAGKTLLLQVCLQDLAGQWAHLGHLSYTSMNGADILRSVAYAFGMPSGEQPEHLSPMVWTENQLKTWTSAGETSLLVVDEAQNLPADALQPLLALSQLRHDGRPLLRVVLVGRPPVLELLTSPDLRAWAPAIGAQFSLPALKPSESSAYLAARLGNLAEPGRSAFSAPVLAAIHARTQGRPGQINVLCKQLLQLAILSEENTPVDVGAVHAQADDLGFHPEEAVLDVPVTSVVSAPVVTAESVASPALASTAPFDARPPRLLPALRPVAQPRPLALAKPLAPTPLPTPAGYRHRLLPLLAVLLVAGAATALYFRPSAPVHEAQLSHETAKPATPPTTAPTAPTPTDPAVSAVAGPAPAKDPAGVAPAPSLAPQTAAAPAVAAPTAPPAPMATAAPPARPAAPVIAAVPSPRVTPHAARPTAAMAPPAAVVPVSTSKNRNPVCAPLLAQLSLGEPLTKHQQHTLESTCR